MLSIKIRQTEKGPVIVQDRMVKRERPDCRDELSEYVKTAMEKAGFSIKDLALKFKFRHVPGIIERLNDFENRGDFLPKEYANKLFSLLDIDKSEYFRLEEKRKLYFAEFYKLEDEKKYKELKMILKYSDEILARPEFYFITAEDIFFSTAYICTNPLTLGELVTHWKNGCFIDNELCCGTVYQKTVGGSPLTGINGWGGVCIACGRHVDTRFGRDWGVKLGLHINFRYPFDIPKEVCTMEEFIIYAEEKEKD